ncbi:MAG TPA: HRDC domain-containing protein [Anaerolineaceae bacterium]
MKPPIWVDQPRGLNQMAERLLQFKSISVDTESNSLHAYQEQVCLIQFSTTEEDYLLDPLALTDLTLLAPIFDDPGIEKIFHAAEYDLICLRRDFHFQFANMFDTMVAARILGRQAVGLGSMLEAEFGIHADKRFQRANWAQRPLPAAQLAYARLDTHFLLPLRNILRQELAAASRLELAEQDFQRMAKIFSNGHGPELDPTAEAGSRPPSAARRSGVQPQAGAEAAGASAVQEAEAPDGVWRISGIQDLSPRQVAILSELVAYRNRQARASNLPAFKVLSNQTLIAIAQAAPASRPALESLDALSSYQFTRHASGLLDGVHKGLNAPPLRRPSTPRPDDRYLQRMEALRGWRKHMAQSLGVESDVILPRDLLYSLVDHNPQDIAGVEALLVDSPWRAAHYGPDILSILKSLR